MGFEFDDNPPTGHHSFIAMPTSQKPSEKLPEDYTWLERLLPYEPDAENNLHWFVRFK